MRFNRSPALRDRHRGASQGFRCSSFHSVELPKFGIVTQVIVEYAVNSCDVDRIRLASVFPEGVGSILAIPALLAIVLDPRASVLIRSKVLFFCAAS